MSDPLRRHKYAVSRILIPAARILSPEFNAAYVFLTGSHVEILRNLLDYATRETTFVDEYHDGYYLSPDATDWDSLSAIVADLEELLMTTVLGPYDAYVHVRDKKPTRTNGGTFQQAGWRTRDINDEVADTADICAISTNRIILQAGTYRTIIHCPARMVDRVQARLYNNTASAMLLLSESSHHSNANSDCGRVLIVGRFVLSEASFLEIQHRCSTTQADDGFGRYADIGDEIYTEAEFWRET